MNKEQWACVAGLALLLLGVYFTVTSWRPEKQFQPPPIRRGAGNGDEPEMEPPIFASEDDECEFRASGRDPFIPKRDTEPLPLAELLKPPLPGLKRVMPGPMPGLGHSRLRTLEEPVVDEKPIDLTGGPGTEGGEEDEEEEDDEWGRRRY